MAKGRAYDNLYARLETKEGEKELYRLAKQRDRAGKDIQHMLITKDKNGNVMVNLEAVLKRVVWTCHEERPRVCRKKDDGNAVTRKEEKRETKEKIFRCSERRYGGSWCKGDGR